jgi:2-dehydro-3-deoxygalactonokinase
MLAVDWGTSSLRIYRLDADGKILDVRHSPNGILSVNDEMFSRALENEAGDWISADEGPILMSGMIGSRQGWKEAAYVSCPAGISEIASALTEVTWNTNHAWIAPGLRCRHLSGVHDVMRGEEVQILGIVDDLGDGEHRVCLPGTHSKWVTVRDKNIVSFTTHMTGEVFAVLREHSILGRTMNPNSTMASDQFSETAFLSGVSRSSDRDGLLHHLFGVRAQVLSDELGENESASYLSGILIGHELRSSTTDSREIHLLGSTELTKLYTLAASTMNMDSVVHDAEAVTRGLYAVAQQLSGNP